MSDIYIRDASGNIMATYKEKSVINGQSIEWVNDNIINEHGGWTTPSGTGIIPFIIGSFGANSGFSMSMISTGISLNPSWSGTQSSSLALSEYLSASDAIYSQAVQEPISEYFDDMAGVYPGIVQEAFNSNGQHSAFSGMFNALISDRDYNISYGTLLLLAQRAPDLASDMIDYCMLTNPGNNPADMANTLYNHIEKYSAASQVHGAFMAKVQNHDVSNFYEHLVTDGNILNNTWMSNNHVLATQLAGSIGSYGPRDQAVQFFDSWLQANRSDWLEHHSSLDERLHVVYNSNKPAFLNGYLGQVGVPALNQVIQTMPGMTVSSYLQLVQQGVMSGTLNPAFQPPTVNTPGVSNVLA
ncbi:MAG: hypothetical protein EOP49_27435, partial [Sphingobacteriales bacterium]